MFVLPNRKGLWGEKVEEGAGKGENDTAWSVNTYRWTEVFDYPVTDL